MAIDPKIVVGDRPTLEYYLVHAQTGVPITDILSAKLRWRIGALPTVESVMSVDAPSSLVRYTFGVSEISIAGPMRAEVRILDTANKPHTAGEIFTYPVRDSL